MNKKTQVLIVGGGPTGVTLGCHFLKHGIPFRLIEKRPDQTKQSKAININSGSLQMFDRLGFSNRFVEQGIKVRHIYIHWENKRIIHVNYNLIESPYAFFCSMPQAKSERLISDYLEENGGRIERNIELTELSVQEKHVEVVLKHQDGKIEKEQYEYLIACDGAKSTVRNTLELPFPGYDYHKHYHLFDGYVDCGNKPIEDTHYFVNEKGYFIIAPMVGGYHRMVLYDESNGTKTCTSEEYQQLIDLYGPGYVKLKQILWNSKGFFYNRLLEDFRYKNRVFFAGDAAHIFSPLGGHGMNTSLQDTDNLAWKLAGVINHSWNDRILDTYNEERRVIAQLLIKNTDFSTRLINKIEKELTQNIENWLPVMRNRGTIRKRASYQFSGLAQQYNLSDFVYTQNQESQEITLVGRYLPYVGNLQCGGKIINTYRLSKLVPVILIFGQYDDRVTSAVKHHRFHIYNIVSKTTALASSDTPLFQTVIDQDDELKTKCRAQEGDIFLLRPDGVFGFKGHQSALGTLTQYLDKWYTVEEKR
jgi:2-polyprenyl-6-methoxyphenol hydroxylase-like FAD-dependent oxidoreductase